jgi:hypothetical protein
MKRKNNEDSCYSVLGVDDCSLLVIESSINLLYSIEGRINSSKELPLDIMNDKRNVETIVTSSCIY